MARSTNKRLKINKPGERMYGASVWHENGGKRVSAATEMHVATERAGKWRRRHGIVASETGGGKHGMA